MTQQGPTLQDIEKELFSHRAQADLHSTAADRCEIILNQARENEGLRKQIEQTAAIVDQSDKQIRDLTEQLSELKLTVHQE